MKESIFKVSFAMIILSLSIICNAQISSVIDEEFSLYSLKHQILPLNQLLDSAEMHSPLLKMIDSDIYIHELKIKSQKKNWLSYFSISGSTKYGMYENSSESEDYNGAYLENSNTVQMRYSIGLSLKVPFTSLFDKVERDVALSERKKILYHRDETISELRKLVITQYGNLLMAHAKLIIKTSELEIVKMQMVETELNYKHGKLQLADYTNQKSDLLKLHLVCAEIRIEFVVAVRLMQETIGINLNLNPTI